MGSRWTLKCGHSEYRLRTIMTCTFTQMHMPVFDHHLKSQSCDKEHTFGHHFPLRVLIKLGTFVPFQDDNVTSSVLNLNYIHFKAKRQPGRKIASVEEEWHMMTIITVPQCDAAVTPSRKICPVRATCMRTIFAKLSGTWLSRGSYGVYVAVTRSMWPLRGLRPVLFAKIALRGSYGHSYSIVYLV